MVKRSLLALSLPILLVAAVSCGSTADPTEQVISDDMTDATVVEPSTTAAPPGDSSASEESFHSDDPEVQALYDLIVSGAGSPSDQSPGSLPNEMDPTLPTVMLGSTEYVDTPAGQRVWVIRTSCDSVKVGLGAEGMCGPDTALTFTDGSHDGVVWVQDPAGPVGVQLNSN